MPRYVSKVHHSGMHPGEVVLISDPEAWEAEIARGFLVALDEPQYRELPVDEPSVTFPASGDSTGEPWALDDPDADEPSPPSGRRRRSTKAEEPGLVPGESEPWG